jgi:hypothetical protein
MDSKQVVSIGNIATISIDPKLPYAAALQRLVKDAVGNGVTIDPEHFYSEEAVELHNVVDSIFYRFLCEDGVNRLVYEVTNRPDCIYREVTYDGDILKMWSWDAEFGPFSTEEAHRRDARRKTTLGI